jgi:hypothetical protein
MRRLAALVAVAVLSSSPLLASDHADPIDPFNRERLEGGITDLFFFPILEDGKVAFPFERKDRIPLWEPDLSPRPALTPDQRSQIKGYAAILCVRRALTQTGSLRLEPYTYRIHMDLNSTVSFADTEGDKPMPQAAPVGGAGYTPSAAMEAKGPTRPTGAEARARYGGIVVNPDGIADNVTIEFTLGNDAKLRDVKIDGTGLRNVGTIRRDGQYDPKAICAWAGVRDDPFIFPAFFGTNVVAMVMTIPASCFPDEQQDWILWGTSSKGTRQVDHVGRSLRTQNPRFELLNTLPPRAHRAAIQAEHDNPSLMRDIALRFNGQSLFAYRKWDFVPDVMIYTNRVGVGFPNGRLLTDDVAPMLAQHGDTLLLELSHQVGGWPRKTTNDKPFSETFPYLAEPWPDKDPVPPPALSMASWYKIIAILIGLLLLLILENWIVAVWYYRKKLRQRYL